MNTWKTIWDAHCLQYVSGVQYMRDVFQIILDAMKSPVDDVVLQGIEFWTTICEEEMTLQMEAEDVSVLALVVAYAHRRPKLVRRRSV